MTNLWRGTTANPPAIDSRASRRKLLHVTCFLKSSLSTLGGQPWRPPRRRWGTIRPCVPATGAGIAGGPELRLRLRALPDRRTSEILQCTTCFPDGPVSTSPTDHKVSEDLVYNEVVNGGWQRISDAVSFESTKDRTPPKLPADFDKQPKVGAEAEFVAVP